MESKLQIFVTLPNHMDGYIEVWFEATPRHEKSVLMRIIEIINPKTAEKYKLSDFPLESDRLRIAERTWEMAQELRFQAEESRIQKSQDLSDEMHRNGH